MFEFTSLVFAVFLLLNQCEVSSQGNNCQHSSILCDEGPLLVKQVASSWSQRSGAGCNSGVCGAAPSSSVLWEVGSVPESLDGCMASSHLRAPNDFSAS